MNKEEYRAYLETPHWDEVRATAYKVANGHCEVCGVKALGQKYHSNVHHLSYAHLGAERPEDVVYVCRRCHDVETLTHRLFSPHVVQMILENRAARVQGAEARQ